MMTNLVLPVKEMPLHTNSLSPPKCYSISAAFLHLLHTVTYNPRSRGGIWTHCWTKCSSTCSAIWVRVNSDCYSHGCVWGDFQREGAATEKALSPQVRCLVLGGGIGDLPQMNASYGMDCGDGEGWEPDWNGSNRLFEQRWDLSCLATRRSSILWQLFIAKKNGKLKGPQFPPPMPRL